MWFRPEDIKYKKPIELVDLKGYVLPHAGTKFTSNILSHTLRFKPPDEFLNKIKNIFIIFSPAQDNPNVGKEYHEYHTVNQAFNYVFKNFWNIKKKVNYIPVNIRENINFKPDLNHDLIIISADFSHFLPMQKAIYLENCAAHSILQRYFNLSCSNIIDRKEQFELLYKLIPKTWMLQWVGRMRSPGIKGVGYLSFLIRDNNYIPIPDGIFVTVYDKDMRQKECLGEWFNETNKFTKNKVANKIKEVIYKGKTTARLTNGNYLNIPLYSYTITYLYKESTKQFIRGWHGIQYNAFYLPDVFLENTFNNGNWIRSYDNIWPQQFRFNLDETLEKLNIKAFKFNKQKLSNKDYILYSSRVIHQRIL